MSEGRLVMEVGQYFGPFQPRRPTRDSPDISEGQSAPDCLYPSLPWELTFNEHLLSKTPISPLCSGRE